MIAGVRRGTAGRVTGATGVFSGLPNPDSWPGRPIGQHGLVGRARSARVLYCRIHHMDARLRTWKICPDAKSVKALTGRVPRRSNSFRRPTTKREARARRLRTCMPLLQHAKNLGQSRRTGGQSYPTCKLFIRYNYLRPGLYVLKSAIKGSPPYADRRNTQSLHNPGLPHPHLVRENPEPDMFLETRIHL